MCRTMKSGLLAGSAAFAALGVAGAAHGQQIVVYVDESNNQPGSGSSWATAFNDLQAAFDSIGTLTPESVRGVAVEFRIAQGTYRPQQFRTNAFSAGSRNTASAASLTIRGGWGGLSSTNPDVQDFVATATVLSADVLGDDGPNFSNRADNCNLVLSTGPSHGIASSPPVALEGLVLEGGERTSRSVYSGGFVVGPSFQGATPVAIVLRDCVVRENRSRLDGAGVLAGMGTSGTSPGLTMIRCVITHNHSDRSGGGVCVTEGATANMDDCVVTENTADGDGGGIWTGGYLSVNRAIIAGNECGGSGGGLFKYGSSFAGWVYSCLIAANHAALNGGGVACNGYGITACTFVDNSAAWGGGLYLMGWSNVRWSLFFRNSARFDGRHMAGPIGPTYQDLNYVANDPNSLFFPFNNEPIDFRTQIILVEPQLTNPDGPDGNPATWKDNDYRPRPRSHTIDVVPGSTNGNLDLDGHPRAVSGIVGRPALWDAGCYESQLTLCPADLDADQAITVDDLLDFLHAFEMGDSLADLTTNGLTPFPDGAVTVEDLLFFLAKFEGGC